MSNTLLIELKQEADRLYVAGSDLAAGDYRLKRLLPRFEALGGQAPVFGKLAELIRRLTDAQAAEAGPAWRLQELGLLLGSILATQSGAQPQEAASPLKSEGLSLSTGLTCRQLAQVERALTESGGGRYEIVTEAFRLGYFSDLRLFPLAVRALGDPYPELAEFVLEHIIPLYGPAAAPYLAADFDPKGGKKEGRKLLALSRLGCLPQLILSAAEEGSDEVRVAAISCLAASPEHTDLLIGYTRDRKKAVREAAYRALAAGRDDWALETLYGAFAGKDRELAAEALSRAPWPELGRRLSPMLRDELEQAATAGWSAEDKRRTEAWDRIQAYLSALGDSRNPDLDQAYAGVVRNSHAFQTARWESLLHHAADYLSRSGAREDLELLFALEERYEGGLSFAFRAAYSQLSAKELFDRYGGTWTDKLKAAVTRRKSPKTSLIADAAGGLVLRQELRTYQVLLPNGEFRETTRMEMLSPGKIAAAWDSRWLDWAIRHDAQELVCAFARPGHKACREYLLDKLANNRDKYMKNAVHLLQGLERSGNGPDIIWEPLLQLLEDTTHHTFYSLDYYIVEQLRKLPRSYLERLRKLKELYRYDSAGQIQYVLEELEK